jgi:ABC-type transport system involved in Fe-S cluster assembly fused permease/ATPase subunit
MLVGLFFVAFSKEEEENQDISNLRLLSLIIAIYVNTIFLIISIFFVFGIGFVEVMIVNLLTSLLFYIIIFKYNIHKRKNSERNVSLSKED